MIDKFSFMSLMRKKKRNSFVKCSLPSDGYCQFSSRVFRVGCRENWIPMSKRNFCKANTHGNWLKRASLLGDECHCAFLMLKNSFTRLPTWLLCFTVHLILYSAKKHHKWLIICRALSPNQFQHVSHDMQTQIRLFVIRCAKCHANISCNSHVF